MKIFGKTILAASLCALVMAPGALAEDKRGLAYMSYCEGFMVQSNNENGDVECTLEYTRSDIMAITCYKKGPDGKVVARAIEEKEIPGIKKDLNFSHYHAKWLKERPELCK